MCQGKYGPHGEPFFFLIQKESAIAPNSETFSPFINPDIRPHVFSADVLAHCLAHHGGRRKRWGWISSPRAGGRMENGLPKVGKGEAWSEDESVSFTASRKGYMCNEALPVIGLHGPGDTISLFLQDWELAKVVSLDMLCQEMHEAW